MVSKDQALDADARSALLHLIDAFETDANQKKNHDSHNRKSNSGVASTTTTTTTTTANADNRKSSAKERVKNGEFAKNSSRPSALVSSFYSSLIPNFSSLWRLSSSEWQTALRRLLGSPRFQRIVLLAVLFGAGAWRLWLRWRLRRLDKSSSTT